MAVPKLRFGCTDWKNVELKDVTLPEEMKRVLAKAAEAEREKQAVITKSVGEVEAANNLSKAAEMMSTTPGALHLRTLATINDDNNGLLEIFIKLTYFITSLLMVTDFSLGKLERLTFCSRYSKTF